MPNGRCRMHGGVSAGARAPEGLARVRTATLTHGRRTAERVAVQR
ncbi:HGGxSTG domain-containing protein [Methylobacterium fujisawaense]